MDCADVFPMAQKSSILQTQHDLIKADLPDIYFHFHQSQAYLSRC